MQREAARARSRADRGWKVSGATPSSIAAVMPSHRSSPAAYLPAQAATMMISALAVECLMCSSWTKSLSSSHQSLWLSPYTSNWPEGLAKLISHLSTHHFAHRS